MKYKEIINYVVFGVLTTIINIFTFYILNSFNVDYRISTTVAWLISVLFAYFTNKKIVFNNRSGDNSSNYKEMFWFIFYRGLSYLIDLVSMILLVDFLILDPVFSKILVNIFVIVFNYIVSKKVIFK